MIVFIEILPYWSSLPHDKNLHYCTTLCKVYMIIDVHYFQVMGVFGVSILCLHKPFDLINGFVIDDLYCLFLGVTKTLLSLV